MTERLTISPSYHARKVADMLPTMALPMPVLHEDMAQEAQLCFLARPGFDQRAVDCEVLVEQQTMALACTRTCSKKRSG